MSIRGATPGQVATAAVICGIVLAGCGGAAKPSPEAHYVALANQICREAQKPGFGSGRQARIRTEEEDALRTLVNAARKSPRFARYLADEEHQEGEDTYALRSKIYADEKALGLTACLGPSPRNPKCGGRKPGPSGVPSLSHSDARRALQIVGNSRVLVRLLHGVGYSVEHKGSWSGGEENRLIGAVLWLKLAHATTIVGSLPKAGYEPDRCPLYVEQTKYYRADAVTTLRVEVDLNRGVVAGVVPSS